MIDYTPVLQDIDAHLLQLLEAVRFLTVVSRFIVAVAGGLLVCRVLWSVIKHF